jgi:hypothetical protein
VRVAPRAFFVAGQAHYLYALINRDDRPTLSRAFFLSGAQTHEAHKPPALIPAKSD